MEPSGPRMILEKRNKDGICYVLTGKGQVVEVNRLPDENSIKSITDFTTHPDADDNIKVPVCAEYRVLATSHKPIVGDELRELVKASTEIPIHGALVNVAALLPANRRAWNVCYARDPEDKRPIFAQYIKKGNAASKPDQRVDSNLKEPVTVKAEANVTPSYDSSLDQGPLFSRSSFGLVTCNDHSGGTVGEATPGAEGIPYLASTSGHQGENSEALLAQKTSPIFKHDPSENSLPADQEEGTHEAHSALSTLSAQQRTPQTGHTTQATHFPAPQTVQFYGFAPSPYPSLDALIASEPTLQEDLNPPPRPSPPPAHPPTLPNSLTTTTSISTPAPTLAPTIPALPPALAPAPVHTPPRPPRARTTPAEMAILLRGWLSGAPYAAICAPLCANSGANTHNGRVCKVCMSYKHRLYYQKRMGRLGETEEGRRWVEGGFLGMYVGEGEGDAGEEEEEIREETVKVKEEEEEKDGGVKVKEETEGGDVEMTDV